MKHPIFTLCVVLLLCAGCASVRNYVINEKDIIPEGTAYNSLTKQIYIGSIYKQKVIAITTNGDLEEVIDRTSFGDLSPIGMEVDKEHNRLWVNVALAPILNESGKDEWKTTMISFNLENFELIKKYPLVKEEQAFLNDLTVAKDGSVYATESVHGKLYKVEYTTDELLPFLNLENFGFPNGIVYYEPQHCLFVATNEGILKIDIQTKQYALLKCATGIDPTGIDGLAIYKDYFIGHQSSKISRFYFNEGITEIVESTVFDTGDEFDSSTTGELGNGRYHYIVNSQIRSGIDRGANTIKPLDSLENVIIRSKKL